MFMLDFLYAALFLQKDMKPYMDLSESTLYTILKRLETAGMLTVRTAETSTGDVDVPQTTTGGRCEIETGTGDIAMEICGKTCYSYPEEARQIETQEENALWR